MLDVEFVGEAAELGVEQMLQNYSILTRQWGDFPKFLHRSSNMRIFAELGPVRAEIDVILQDCKQRESGLEKLVRFCSISGLVELSWWWTPIVERLRGVE